MIAQLLNLPAWFVSPDDKPSAQLFQQALGNINLNPIECKTIDTPTLSELVIQTSATWNNVINYNYVKWNNYYYMIQDVNYASANNNVVQIRCQIDIYLSFLVSFFNETSSFNQPVFFLQKHLNRYMYNLNNKPAINPATQFYLLNLHQQLGNVGSKKNKHVYTTNNFIYQESETPIFANSNYYNLANAIDSKPPIIPTAYPVILWQMTANSTAVTNANQQLNNSAVYPFPYALGSIGLNTDVVGSSGDTCNAFQWYFLLDKNVALGNEYYTDIYLFPISLNYLTNITVNGTWYGDTSTVLEFTGWNYNANASINLQQGYGTNLDPVLTLSPTNHLYAFATGITSDSQLPSTFLMLDDEPALINYANYNVRLYGQDNHIDLTSFILNPADDGSYLITLTIYLASFCITISPPNMMLTNIPWVTWNETTPTPPLVEVWNYNQFSDVIYSCQLKATAPSASTNWADYIAENKKSYDMSLNVSQLLAQNAQANIKIAQAKYGGSIASYDNVAGDILSIISGSFGNKVASTYADSIGANTLAPNDAAIQQDKLNYLATGMKADYTRTSNMRTSAISTINTLYDSTFCLVLEYPPLYEQIAVINYYALFGYKLERWLPFSYWNNRTLCNYVKIANFSNAVINDSLNAYYRGAIDSLLNKGVRIWNVASNDLQGYSVVPYDLVIMNGSNTYQNVELNQDNDELNYLINNANN